MGRFRYGDFGRVGGAEVTGKTAAQKKTEHDGNEEYAHGYTLMKNSAEHSAQIIYVLGACPVLRENVREREKASLPDVLLRTAMAEACVFWMRS